MAPSPLDLLRPKPFRGDVIAAGVVVLVTLVWVVEVRFAATWGAGARLAWALVPWAFVTALAVLAPMEAQAPRAYQSVLYIGSVVLALAGLIALGEVLGARRAFSSEGNATWVLAVLAGLSLAFATRRNSAACTLLGALSGGAAVLAFVGWAFHPVGLATFRWVLLGLMVVFGFAAVAQRDRRLRHGVALIDAAGLAALAIALTFVQETVLLGTLSAPDGGGNGHVGSGWELLIVAAGFGLIAYSSVDRQPGPAYLGVANLVAFAVITSLADPGDGATLLGWPLALAIAAAVLLAIGLRPTTPAPPPPDVDAPEPPPLPWR
ncbi:MAG: hypothetical protein QOK49_125 [Baekduia sp.]|nr:hypothetical protein [Baekduia sp.]